MQGLARVRLIAAGLAGLLSAIGAGQVAWAGPSPHMTTGHWVGFAQSVDDPNIRDQFTMDVSSQSKRRFSADICGMIIDGCTPVQGTIAESGHLSVVGRSSPAQILKVEGTSHGLTSALPGEFDPCVFEGHFTIALADGSHHNGNLVAVHQVPDADAPSFAGERFGRTSNGDTAHATLSQDGRGAITGLLELTDPSGAARAFRLNGQAFGDSTHGGFLLVGGARDALIAIAISGPDNRGAAGSYVMLKEVDPAPGKPSAVVRGSITLSAEVPAP